MFRGRGVQVLGAAALLVLGVVGYVRNGGNVTFFFSAERWLDDAIAAGNQAPPLERRSVAVIVHEELLDKRPADAHLDTHGVVVLVEDRGGEREIKASVRYRYDPRYGRNTRMRDWKIVTRRVIVPLPAGVTPGIEKICGQEAGPRCAPGP